MDIFPIKKPSSVFGPYYCEKPNAVFSTKLILRRLLALHFKSNGVRLQNISEITKPSILVVILKMNAQKKIKQAQYHLDLMGQLPPNEDEYIFNLVSFITSVREVTWYLQKEFKHHSEFDDWYKNRQQEMKEDELLRFFLNKRNVVVKETYPDVKEYTGEVKFYYTNASGEIAVGSCWAHPSSQPTDIIVPGGIVTIAPNQVTAKTSLNTILRKVNRKAEYFFEDNSEIPIVSLCNEYLIKLEKLCMAWEDKLKENINR